MSSQIEAWELADAFAVAGCRGSPRRLHIANDDQTGPVCGVRTPNEDWRIKPVSVYPEGYQRVCGRCIKKIRGSQ